MNNANNANNILSTILDCGTCDVDFLIEELENWQVNFDDIWDGSEQSCNDLIACIYRVAFSNAIDYFKSPKIDEDDQLTDSLENKLQENFDIYINSIDSHFWLNDANGDQEEIHNYDELIAFIAKFIADSK